MKCAAPLRSPWRAASARWKRSATTAARRPRWREGKLYAGDADFYRKQLNAYAAVTPTQVRDAMRQWLGRPVFAIRLEPGDRPPYEEAKGPPPAKASDIKVASVKRQMPPAAPPEALDFPAVERTTLANGIKVTYAQRTAAPLTHVVLSFDAGFAADQPAERGLQNMTMALLDEGTEKLTAQQIAEAKERLGASLNSGGSADRSFVMLSALSPNLVPSLGLMTEIVERPAFAPTEIERIRSQLLTAIAQAKTTPSAHGRAGASRFAVWRGPSVCDHVTGQ